MTINQILTKGIIDLETIGVSNPQLEAEILLSHAIVQTGLKPVCTQEWLLANPNFPINNSAIQQFNNFIKRRKKFEPMAFITGHKEFYGYDFYVDNRVLIPRPESELLVEKAMANLESRISNLDNTMDSIFQIPDSRFQIVELGTGSGCIIISLIKELQRRFQIDRTYDLLRTKFEFMATDISQDALDVAKINAKNLKVDRFIQFVVSDLFESLKAKSQKLKAKFELIIANLPYVPSYWIADGPTEYGLVHEPKISLDGGEEGIDVYQRFFQEVPKYLAEDGTILIECEDDQINKILKILNDLKYKYSHKVYKDYNDLQRVIEIKFLL